tara:strand:+ start:8679 stop:9386 length:708 start_codon:yes stop_codon:yes gene_type:complete
MNPIVWTQDAVRTALGDRNVLALETSVRESSVALATPVGIRTAKLGTAAAHASDLLPEIARLIEEAGLAPANLDAIFVGLGPGSYTGLRVGIATALGLARGTGAELQGIPSVEALAGKHLVENGSVSVLLDARGGAAYHARYERDGSAWIERVAPRAIAVKSASAGLAEGDAILGDTTIADRANLTAEQRERLITDALPEATGVLERAALRFALEGALPAEQLEPLYLRAFGEQA